VHIFIDVAFKLLFDYKNILVALLELEAFFARYETLDLHM